MNSDSYLEKITSAHITRPRYMAWLRFLLDMLCEYGSVVETMNLAFYIESAAGKQLDTIGAYVGASRALPFTSEYSDDGILPDEEYRALIKAKILRNMWDGSNETLPGLWQAVYPSLQMFYEDNLDMTMTIMVTGDLSNSMTELIQAGMIVPCPSGVHQTFIINTATIPAAEVNMGAGVYEFGNDDFPNQAE